jgi:monothiol glutaredoxin
LTREAPAPAGAQDGRRQPPVHKEKIMTETNARIDQIVRSNDVVLFMKGSALFPQCGFSSRAVAILDHLGVNFETVDVLQDAEIRNGIKAYSDWPTIPQLYVKGEFVGGSDIMMEMYEAGELQQLLNDNQVAKAG